MSKGKGRWLTAIVFVVLVILVATGKNISLKNGIILLVLVSAYIGVGELFHYFYWQNEGSIKDGLIVVCFAFISTAVLLIAIQELVGLSFDYSLVILIFLTQGVAIVWQHLNLTTFDKGVLLLTIVAMLGIRAYEKMTLKPTNAVGFYQENLEGITGLAKIEPLLGEGLVGNFTLEDYKTLELYLQQFPVLTKQPALFEFKDGQIIILEVTQAGENKPLQISNLALLPEKIASYFRHYPLEIRRVKGASVPGGEAMEKTIIATKGAFIQQAHFYRKKDWSAQLSNVFGKKEGWDWLWQELDDLQAPKGPVVSFGINEGGYLVFRFATDWTVDEKIIDDIYQLVDGKAAENGIVDLPVVFQWATSF